MLEQMRAEDQAQRAAGRADPSSSSPAPGSEGYWAYMQRQVQERTQNLNIMGDSMDRMEDNSAKWGDDVSKFVGRTKKKVVMGGEFIEPCALSVLFCKETNSITAVKNTLGF